MQTFWILFLALILPLSLGCGLRFFFRKQKKAWLVTTAGVLLTAIAVINYYTNPGFELFLLWEYACFLFTAAAAVTGFLFRPSRQ